MPQSSEIAALLDSLSFAFANSFLPKYRVKYCDYIVCDDVDNMLDNTCEVIRQETVLFSTPETDYIIYD